MLNKVIIMGRLCSDPTLRWTQNNTAVASFTLACERDFSDSNGTKQTDFIDCVAWRNTAEFASKYFRKGGMAVAAGRLQIREWQDKEGQKHKSAEIMLDSLYFGESKKAEKLPDVVIQDKPVLHELDDSDGVLPF